jgi:NADPH-dependent 2,4-dienoyl-CoA reductase/sulfur reductase-like enzyme
MSLQHVVVVGASLAGLRACETLRSEGFTERITVIGAERHAPYDRPPLSKKVLSGEWEPARIALRRPDDMAGLGVQWRLGVSAAGLDTAGHAVHLADGEVVGYDGLIVATGSAVRRLAGQPDLAGVHVLRTLDDSLALREVLGAGDARLVVIGAGFIGLEVAATAAQLGNSVTVLEGLPAPLVRGLGARMGEAVGDVHRRHGVDLRCGVQVAAIDGDDRVRAVRLGDGTTVTADVVVVGIGVSPATGWLDGSDLAVRDGVVCDEHLQTAVPGVYAAGDVARWTDPLTGEDLRLEHWTNAAEQGAHAARNLLAASGGARQEPFAPVPFFWSDQFDARIQFLGRARPDDDVEIVAGSVEEGRFVALYGSAGRLHAALGVSLPRVVMPYRALLAEGASWDDALALAADAR